MDDDGLVPEHVLCRRWREEVLELSRSEMAALTGYSADAIKDYERADKAVDGKARKRYRLAVAAASFGIEFDWEEARCTPPVRVEMVIRRPKK